MEFYHSICRRVTIKLLSLKPMKRILYLIAIAFVPFCLGAQSYYQWVGRADSCIQVKDWVGAEQSLLNALRAEPANGQNQFLMSNLGTVQRYAGKYEEALKSYSNGLLMDPQSIYLLRNRAALFAEMDSLEGAYQDYSRILLIDETDEDALYHRGLISLERNDTIASRADFERILKLNPASGNGRIGFASWLKAMGYYPEAIDVYSQVIRMNPDKVMLFVGRAEAYLFAGQYAKADKDIERVIELTPNDPEGYVLRALGNLARYEDGMARKNLERAVELGYDPEEAKRLLNEE